MRIEDERVRCLKLNQTFYSAGENVSKNSCSPHWDQSLCWDATPTNETMHRECPFTFCSSCEIEDRFAYRDCFARGVWNRSDYGSCIEIVYYKIHCIETECRPCADLFKDAVRWTTLVLCVLSVIMLIFALVIFSRFTALHCRRLTIHVNLSIAFVLRFSSLTVWILLHKHNVFYECSQLSKIPRRDLEWLCKVILWMTIYFQAASVFWMFVEGAHLISRFTVFAMRHSEGPFVMYFSIGWGFSLLTVLLWSFLHETHSAKKSFCWMPFTQSEYLWVLVAPMGSALLLNFLFLLVIIGILVQKLRAENTAESQKIWKAIKATLLLVPLLGVANILLFYEPESAGKTVKSGYMLISAILQYSQGISVAVLYCFANGEVHNAVLRRLKKTSFWSDHMLRKGKKHTHYTDPNIRSHDWAPKSSDQEGFEIRQNIMQSHSYTTIEPIEHASPGLLTAAHRGRTGVRYSNAELRSPSGERIPLCHSEKPYGVAV